MHPFSVRLLLASLVLAAAPFARAFAFLGLYSYEVYLLHQPLIRDYSRHALAVWWQVLQPSRGDLLAGIIGALLLVFFLSVWLHRATERLFRPLRRTSAT